MFSAPEDKAGGPPVVVIGEGLWRERFSTSPDVLGRTLKLDGVAHTIIGIMPATATSPETSGSGRRSPEMPRSRGRATGTPGRLAA